MSQRNQNTLKLSSFNQMASEVVKVRLNIFRRFRKSSENRRKSLEVAGTISEIPSMTRQKSLKSQSHLTGKKLAGMLQAAMGSWGSRPMIKHWNVLWHFTAWRVTLYSWFHYWFTCEKPATFLDRGYRRRIPNQLLSDRDLSYPFLEAFLLLVKTAVSSGLNSTIQLQF